jgi:predicted MFS family arabinose efflux permease
VQEPRSTPAAAKQLALWYALLVVWLIVGISMGRAQSMGLFQLPLIDSIGVGRADFSLSMALTFLLMGIGAPVTGALIDKYGAGRVVAVCLVATIAGLYFYLAARSPLDLVIGGVLMGIGVSGTGITSLVGLIGKLSPPEKRLRAIASIGMAAGIGSFVALPVIHLLIEKLGWQTTIVCLMVSLAALIPLALSLGGRIEDPGKNPRIPDQTIKQALAEALTHPGYLLLTAGFFVCGFHVSFIVAHLPAFAVDQGLPGWVGPVALSAVGIMNLVGTWVAGQSGSWIEKRKGLSLIYLGRAVIFVGFLVLPMTPWVVIGLCSLLGLLWLATVPLTSGLVATFFGTTWMSMLFGIAFLSHQVGSFLGVWMAGKLFDATKSYDAMWYISIALGVISALLNWPIRERPVARLTENSAAAAKEAAGAVRPAKA